MDEFEKWLQKQQEMAFDGNFIRGSEVDYAHGQEDAFIETLTKYLSMKSKYYCCNCGSPASSLFPLGCNGDIGCGEPKWMVKKGE